MFDCINNNHELNIQNNDQKSNKRTIRKNFFFFYKTNQLI